MFGVKYDLSHMEKSVQKLLEKPIDKNKILFYGPSNFTRWSGEHRRKSGEIWWDHRPLEEDIRMKDGSVAAVNNGFGSSTITDLLYNYDRLVRPWEPRVLVLSTANNVSAGYTPYEVVTYLALICDYATHDFPNIPIYCLGSYPCPKYDTEPDKTTRWYYEFNTLLETFCKTRENIHFVNTGMWPMFYNNPKDIGTHRNVRTDIFVADQIHFNQAGYDLYRDAFLELLDEHL